jgi:hypothetical protein
MSSGATSYTTGLIPMATICVVKMGALISMYLLTIMSMYNKRVTDHFVTTLRMQHLITGIQGYDLICCHLKMRCVCSDVDVRKLGDTGSFFFL